MKIPKNISSMTDEQHHAWIVALSTEDWDAAERKTFRVVEFVVSLVDASGDIIETEAFDSLAEAEASYQREEPQGVAAVVLERCTNFHSVLTRDLEDRQYKTLKTRGDYDAIMCGGF